MTNVTNVRKTSQMNIIMSQKYYFDLQSGSNLICFRLLTIENIIFMSKIVRKWLESCASIPFLLLGIGCGAIFDKVHYNRLLLFMSIFVCKCLKVNV